MRRKLCLTMVAASLAIPAIFSATPLTLNDHDNLSKGGFSIMSASTPVSKTPAPARLAPRYNSGEILEEIVVVDEDFSLFTAGTQEEPDEEFLGIPGEPYIDNELTKEPGWSTNYATQAGGACALNTPIGGFINTPIGDYSGKVSVSFRFKRLSPDPVSASMGVILAGGDIWYPEVLDMAFVTIGEEEINGEGELDEEGWKNFSCTFSNEYAGNDGFIQLGAYYCQVLVDDIKVSIIDDGSVAAPTVLPASDFTLTGFTAKWSEVRLADSYLFSLYHEEVVSDPLEETYDFDGNSAEPWTLDGITTTTSDQGYEGSAAFVVDQNSYITSPVYDGRLASISIWMRNIGEDPYYASVTLQGFNGKEWTDVGTMYTAMVPFDEEGGTLVINSSTRPSFYNAFNQVRFAFQGWDYEAEDGIASQLVIDHLEIETLSGVEKKYDITEMPTSECMMVLSDLDAYEDYYYEVGSVRGENKEWSSPMLAFGISTPEVTEASDITIFSYTANWLPTPKASLYRVRDLGVFTAEKDINDCEILYESFGVVEGGTREEPLSLENGFTPCSLDEYTVYPGWIGASTIIADGMVGAGGAGFAYIQTPELTLSNSNGDFSVEITVDLLYDDAILITPSSADAEYIGFEAVEGENTVVLDYHNGSSNETLRISSQYGAPFYIRDITVTQDLKKDESVFTYLNGKVVDGDCNSFIFDNVDFDNYSTHAYDVMAIYNKDLKQCVSERSPYEMVSYSTDVKILEKDMAGLVVKSGKGFIEVESDAATSVAVLSIDGKTIAVESLNNGNTATFAVTPGIYIVKAADSSRKVIVK